MRGGGPETRPSFPLSLVDPKVPFHIALVAALIRTQRTRELPHAGVHGQVTPEEGLAGEGMATDATVVAFPVTQLSVCPQLALTEEGQAAAVPSSRGHLMHGEGVTLEVVLSVSAVVTQGTTQHSSPANTCTRHVLASSSFIGHLENCWCPKNYRRLANC